MRSKMKRFAKFLLLMSALTASASESVWQAPAEPSEPYRIDHIRDWHQAWGEHWPWGQPEYPLHLRDDGREQRLLMIDGHARGGTFLLFLQQSNEWRANQHTIELAHHPVHVLTAQHDGWHEFETYVPTWGSGGAEVWVFRYRWNGQDYEQAEQREASWCELEYFRATAAELCAAPAL